MPLKSPRDQEVEGSTLAASEASATILAPRHTTEFRVYAAGEAIDASPLADTLPERGLLPRRRSRLQRVVIGLSGGTLLLIVLAVLGLATVLSPPGSSRRARAGAEQELVSELDGGRARTRARVRLAAALVR